MQAQLEEGGVWGLSRGVWGDRREKIKASKENKRKEKKVK